MKKTLSYLLITGLLASKLTVFQVNAVEINPEQSKESEMVDFIAEADDTNVESVQQIEQETNTDENTISETPSDLEYIQEVNIEENTDNEQNTSINKPIDLKWNPDKPGSFSFNSNNTEGTEVGVYIYKDGMREYCQSSTDFNTIGICSSDISTSIDESGDYTFRVHIVFSSDDFFDDSKGILSDYSDVFHYVKPEQKVETPMVRWDTTNPGRVVWSDVQHAQIYEVNISNDGFNNTWVSRGKFIDNEDNFSSVMEPNTVYQLRAKAYSDNINLYAHSDFSEPVEFYFEGVNNSNDNNQNTIYFESSKDYSSNNEISKYIWQPTTEEEKIRYACFGKEKVEFTIPNNQPFNINIQNAMQGEKCFDVFRNVAGDYTIARTYNIYPLESETKYATNNKVTISLTVPKTLQKENREFKMICVSQNGLPYIFEDQDKDPNTITFSTDKFYAFALIYKDKN